MQTKNNVHKTKPVNAKLDFIVGPTWQCSILASMPKCVKFDKWANCKQVEQATERMPPKTYNWKYAKAKCIRSTHQCYMNDFMQTHLKVLAFSGSEYSKCHLYPLKSSGLLKSQSVCIPTYLKIRLTSGRCL